MQNTKDKAPVETKVKLYCGAADLISYSPKLSYEKKLGDIMTWGDTNNLPDFLFELYENSTSLQASLNGITDYVYGGGIINNTTFRGKNEFGDTLDNVVYKSILDCNITGGAFIQVKKNYDGSVICAHLDPRKCRVSKCEKFVVVSDVWGKYGQRNNTNLQKFHTFDPETLMDDGVQIYYYKGERSRGTYPVCEYKSALVSCEIEVESNKYDYKNIVNGLSMQGILNISGDVPPEAREQILDAIVKMYTGAENAGRILTTFTGDTQSQSSPVTFTPFTGNDADQRFANTVERASASIFTAMRANPICFGLNVQTGFADQNFEEAYDMLYITHVIKKRKQQKEIFGEIYGNTNAIGFLEVAFGGQSNEEKSQEDMGIEEIPEAIYPDLTINERRELAGFEPLPDSDADESILAETLGVGGTEALVNVVRDPDLPDEQKRGVLKILFGLDDERVNVIMGYGQK